MLLIQVVALSSCLPVMSADFSQAQHIYVPTSMYERRIDYSQPDEAGPQPDSKSQSNGQWTHPATSVKPKSHTYGELPAPPSVAGSNTIVPPPPPYASVGKAARDLH